MRPRASGSESFKLHRDFPQIQHAWLAVALFHEWQRDLVAWAIDLNFLVVPSAVVFPGWIPIGLQTRLNKIEDPIVWYVRFGVETRLGSFVKPKCRIGNFNCKQNVVPGWMSIRVIRFATGRDRYVGFRFR